MFLDPPVKPAEDGDYWESGTEAPYPASRTMFRAMRICWIWLVPS